MDRRYTSYACEGTAALKQDGPSLRLVEGRLVEGCHKPAQDARLVVGPLDDRQMLGCLLGSFFVLGALFAAWALKAVL